MKDVKIYDKEINKQSNAIIEAITVIIIFLISFWAGYIVGESEEKNGTQMSNVQMVSVSENTM